MIIIFNEKQKVKIRWNSYTKKYYTKLGYTFTKINDEFYVYANELQPASGVNVSVICDYCGNEYFPKYKNYRIHLDKDGYGRDCCQQCKSQKRKETFINHYGVEHPMMVEEIKDKCKNTLLEKYGVDNVSKLQQFQEKKKKTNIEKFGSEWYVNSEQFKKLSLERYGTENPMQNEEIKHKTTQTLLNNNNVKTSKQEVKLCKLLLQMYGEQNCIQSYQFKNFVFDCLVIIDNNLIDVEYDGSYWHQFRRNYDRRRDEIIKKDGIKVLRIESNKDKIPNEKQIKEAIEYLLESDNNKYSHIVV